MLAQDSFAQAKFGINEIYFLEGFTDILLEKLYQRAVFSLDAEDNIVKKYASHDMILVFYKQIPTQSLIYQFLKFLNQDIDKEIFIRSNTLLNDDELFSSIKAKKFVLITHRILLKETYSPSLM